MPFRSVRCWSKPCAKIALLALMVGMSASALAAINLAPKSKGRYGYFVTYNGTTVAAPTFDASETLDATGGAFGAVNVSSHASTDAGRTEIIRIEVSSTTVTSAPSSGIYAVTIASSDGTLLPIATINGVDCGEGTGSSQCQRAGVSATSAFGYFHAATFIPGSVSTIGIYPKDICHSYFLQKSAVLAGCEVDTDGSGMYTYRPITGAPKTLTLTVSIRPLAGATTSETPGTAVDTTSVGLVFQVDTPTVTCPSGTTLESLYFPGDGRITLSPSRAFVTSSLPASSSPIEKLIVFWNEGTAPVFAADYASTSNNAYYARVNYSDQPVDVTGFVNTTDGTDHKFNVGFMLRDSTGQLINSSCTQNNVQTSTVQGFLARSQCFIATAAFRSESAAPVVMLRRFRDQVLSQYEPGREFIEWYYRWSPGAAEWLIDHPAFRYPVLVLLMPVELVAWLLLHPEWLAGVALISLLATGAVFLRKRKVWLLVLAFALLPIQARSVQAETTEVETPYIDELKREIGEKDLKKEQPPQGSYTEELKKKLPATGDEESSSYIDELKAEHPEKYAPGAAGTRSYSEDLKQQLEKKEEGSAIQAVLEGHSELELKREGDIHNAFGFRYGTVMSRNITSSGAVVAQNFTTMYGTNYAPDVTLFYEFQPFHSEWFGNIGVLGMLGAAFYSGNGRFQFQLANPLTADPSDSFSAQSTTRFQLFAVPLTLGLNYRFNLFRVLRPFVMAGGTAVGLIEIRNDGGAMNRSYSLAATFGGGVSLLLDWFSRTSTWDLYSTYGIKHYYLTADYFQMLPMFGDVRYGVSGFTAGLTFEF